MPELDAVWSAVIDDVTGILPPEQLHVLRLTRCRALIDDVAVVDVPDVATRDSVESQLKTIFKPALGRALGRTVDIAVRLDPAVSAGPAMGLSRNTAV
uniref:hypothetical protein n=1 Tax=Paractinoplanes polyasparticus TaxID=2856853 RepID=UPI001C8577D6|nr:hypothetical protein [Actinoplanes polyasparticus]